MIPADRRALADALAALGVEAGRAILAHRGATPEAKRDGSPVTQADREAEAIILAGLGRLLPGLPVLAEEEASCGRLPVCGDAFIAVDPLDGTREFVAGRAEFTVNIAVVEKGAPTLGIVHAPALGRLWIGWDKTAETMDVAPGHGFAEGLARRAIHTRQPPVEGPLALVSRSHPEPQVDAFLERHGIDRRQAVGSSLKFALIAEGSADLTVRFAAINEWDIAAGHALLVAAGGRMTTPDMRRIAYGSAENGFRTSAYVACGSAQVIDTP